MVIIGRVSKGSRMDQVYIPKNRSELSIGSLVILKPLEEKKGIVKPYLYNIKVIEPIKLEIIKRIFNIIEDLTDNENIIITGSFLDKGFHFNDIDVVIIIDKKINETYIKKSIENTLQIKIHLITLNNKEFKVGLETEPLYIMMLSRCISKKRFIYKLKNKFYYRRLDLNLLTSNQLTYGFDFLSGNEKYYLIRNMIAILMFIQNKKLTKESVDGEIKKVFNIEIKAIKDNLVEDKKEFLKKCNFIYKKTFNKIMEGVKNSTKQEKTY